MSTPENTPRIRPLNFSERERFVAAVRHLLPPMEMQLDTQEISAANKAFGITSGPDMYSGASFQIHDAILELTETEPTDQPEFHEVVAMVRKTSIGKLPGLTLDYTARYAVNPSQQSSSFQERVRPIGTQLTPPPSNEVLIQQMVETVQEFSSAEYPPAYTFTPARLAEVMPLIAQCHRGNLIGSTEITPEP